MTSTPEYKNIVEASTALLVESVGIVNKIGLEYVIIGGWCPYLRNAMADVVHPGTKDVDILFKDADIEHALKDVVACFLDSGFLVSGKHPFQLLKVFHVGSRDVVLNVDILHPSETKSSDPELFVDHFEFDFCENEAIFENAKFKSIVLPSSKFIFDGFYSEFALGMHGKERGQAGINLIDWSGMFLSKCESFKTRKRPRDSFDILLMFMQPDIRNITGNLKRLIKRNEDVALLVSECIRFLNDPGHGSMFDRNVARYAVCDTYLKNMTPSQFVAHALRTYLS